MRIRRRAEGLLARNPSPVDAVQAGAGSAASHRHQMEKLPGSSHRLCSWRGKAHRLRVLPSSAHHSGRGVTGWLKAFEF